MRCSDSPRGRYATGCNQNPGTRPLVCNNLRLGDAAREAGLTIERCEFALSARFKTGVHRVEDEDKS